METTAYETLIGKTKEQPETQQRKLGKELHAYFEDIFAEELLKELGALASKPPTTRAWWDFFTKRTPIKTVIQDAFKKIGEQLEDRFKNESSSKSRPEIMKNLSDYASQETIARMGEELKKLAHQKKNELTDNNLWRTLDSFIAEAQKVIQNGSDDLVRTSEDWTFDSEL